MDKIKKYLEFVFSDFKATSRVTELKEEIQTNLIEKMNDYIAEGMSEEEASLKAIGSLGNIEDVLKEIGVELNQTKQVEEIYMPIIIDALEDRKRRFAKGSIWISMGVFLCILAAGFASISSIINNEVIALSLFFVPLIIAIPMFIIAGTTYFNVDEKPLVNLINKYQDQDDFKQYINDQRQNDTKRETIGAVIITIGVTFCFIGVLISSIFEIVDFELINLFFFIFIGLGVVCFIQAGMRCFAVTTKNYMKSLNETTCHDQESNDKNSRIITAIDGLMFPLLAITYVAISLFINTSWWSIGWIVFPIYAIISGGIRGVLKATNTK